MNELEALALAVARFSALLTQAERENAALKAELASRDELALKREEAK